MIRAENTANTGRLGMMLLVAAVLVALPFLGIGSLGLSDYPNHMARYHVLENIGTSSVLQENYVLTESRQIYWGMDSVMRLLTPIMGAEAASYAFTLLALYMPLAGALILNRVATGRVNLFAMTAYIFVFSEIAGWGFTNFLFTMGIGLMVLAAWVGTRDRSQLFRIILLAILATLLGLLHVVVAALIGFAIMAWELSGVLAVKRLQKRDVLRGVLICVAFLPAVYLAFLRLETGGGGSGLRWISIAYHLKTGLAPFYFIDGGYGSILHFIPPLLIWFALRTNSERCVTFDRHLLTVAGLVYILGLVSPFGVSSTAFIGVRIPVLAAFIAAASIIEIRPVPTRALLIGLVAAILVKAGLVHIQLRDMDNRLEALREASEVIPAGSRVLPIVAGQYETNLFDPRPIPVDRWSNMAGYLVRDRDALMPYMFSNFGVEPHPRHADYTVQQGYAPTLEEFDTDAAPAYSRNWRQDYDIILVMRFGEMDVPTLPDTELITSSDGYSYHRILKP